MPTTSEIFADLKVDHKVAITTGNNDRLKYLVGSRTLSKEGVHTFIMIPMKWGGNVLEFDSDGFTNAGYTFLEVNGVEV